MSYTETFTVLALAPMFVTGLAVWITATIYIPLKEEGYIK